MLWEGVKEMRWGIKMVGDKILLLLGCTQALTVSVQPMSWKRVIKSEERVMWASSSCSGLEFTSLASSTLNTIIFSASSRVHGITFYSRMAQGPNYSGSSMALHGAGA